MVGRRLLHYDIIERLGQGGASVVYKARDTRLDRFVALKFLTHLRASPESARALLFREARAISALSHPNIAALFDVVEADGEAFLVLEYLPGPTLRFRIDQAATAGRGLSLGEALVYALQMAHGLAHAHRRGIIHRDVKPGNAILDAEGNLKLTDFGLAKLLGGPQLTRPGTLLGTVSYMSPEQAQGRPADARSDIFSLGVVLYEMLAGQPPFRGDSETAALYQIVHADPQPLAARRPDLPEPLTSIVARALEKDPARRYPQMGLLGDDLRGVVKKLNLGEADRVFATTPVTAPPAGVWSDPTVSRTDSVPATRGLLLRRRFWLPAAGALALSVLGAVFWPFRRTAGVPSGSLLLVTGIENHTAHPEFAAVTDLLRSQLGQSAHLSLVDDVLLRELLERMVRPPGQKLDLQTAREAAWRGRIPLIVSGRLDQLGSSYPLSLQLEATGSAPTQPKAIWRQAFPARSKDGLFEAIRAASTWIRTMAGEAAQDLSERDQPVAHTTTNSWEALSLYSLAEERVAQDQDEDATLLLTEAVRVDPDFAMAHGRLGDIYVKLKRYAEGYRHWQRAIAASSRRPLTRREELRIKALYALDTGDFRAAENQFRTFCLFFPKDYYPHFYHALTLEWQGRTGEALDRFREAERLQPALYHIPAHLAMAHFTLGQFAPASQAIARVRTLGAEPWSRFLEGVSQFLRGDYLAAADTLRLLTRSPQAEWQSRGYTVQACLLVEFGRYQEALQALTEGLAADFKAERIVAQADKLLALAWVRYLRREFSACRAACLKAVQLESSPNRLRRAGAVLARAGFPEEAGKLLSGHDADAGLPVFRTAQHQVWGEIHLARGRLARALEEFRKADALDFPARPREYLARALESSGDREAAFRLYGKTAEAAATIWQNPEDELPGLWSEALFQCARLARSLGRQEEFTRRMGQYVVLTQHADSGAGHAAEARGMLAEAGRPQPKSPQYNNRRRL